MKITQNVHHQAEMKREEGEFLESLHLYDQAISLYQKDGHYDKIAEVHQGKFLTYQHLFSQTQDKVYLVLAKQAVETSLAIIKTFKEGNSANAYFQLGKYHLLSEDYPQAIKNYNLALEQLSDPDEKGHYQYRLGETLFLSGEEEKGKQTILKGIEDIQSLKNSLDPYVYDVWLSGAYLTLAKLLKTSNPSDAKEYLSKAAQIINSNPKLVLRKLQLENLLQ